MRLVFIMWTWLDQMRNPPSGGGHFCCNMLDKTVQYNNSIVYFHSSATATKFSCWWPDGMNQWNVFVNVFLFFQVEPHHMLFLTQNRWCNKTFVSDICINTFQNQNSSFLISFQNSRQIWQTCLYLFRWLHSTKASLLNQR